MTLRKLLILLSCVFLLCVMSYLMYQKDGLDRAQIIILAPMESITKIRPKDPGGIRIANSDSLIYEQLKQNHGKYNFNASILFTPEKPLHIDRSNVLPVKFLDSIDTILERIKYYEEISIEDDNIVDTVMKDMLQKRDLASTNNQSSSNINDSTDPKSKLQIINISEDRYKIQNLAIVNSLQDGYKIQLSSAYSLLEAQRKWKTIYGKHADILRDAHFIPKKIKGHNERIFYLVMAGVYSSIHHAKLVCRKLSLVKQDCIIVK